VLEKAGMPILWDVQQALHDVALNMRLLWNHDTSTLPWSVVYAPDGKRVYYEDNQDVFALDATTGSELFVIQSAMQRGTTVQISADGKYLATANANRACLWDPQTGQKLLTIPLPGCKPDFGSVKALSPDGRLLLVNYDLDTAQLIDLSPWLTEGSPSGVTRSLPYQLIERCSHIAAGSAFSPDGTCFTTPWLEDNIVILWDSKTARPLRTFSGHTATPMGNSFSPDGSRLATCGYDGTLRIWEVSSGRELIRLSGHNGLVNKVAFSPDGLRLSSTSTEGQVSLWNATNGHRLFDLPTGSGAFGAAFSPDGTRLFVSTHGNQVQLWDVTGCGQGEMKILPFNPGCVSIICSEEGDCILETYANGSIVVRDTSSLAEIASIQAFPNGNSTIATGINRGHTCLATMQQGVYKLWDLARNRQLYEIPPQEGYKPQTDLVPAFHPDGKFLVTGYDPQSISVRDINSSQVLWKLPILQKMIFCDQFSPDGNLLAIGGSRDVLEMGGEWVISLGGGLVSVFQMPMPGEAASEPVVFHGDTRNIRRMSFSPDSKYLAVCGSDEHAEIWDPLTGTLIMHLLSHQSEVTDVHYSPNGCFLVTASQDGTVKIWDASSGTELLSYHLPGNAPCTLACFTPDGQQVIAASEAGYYHQLTFQNFTDLLAILRSRTTRDWSPEERRMYLRKETSTRQFQQPNI
ncbi:MAG: WD40 repeat domain-containing protein, partial [Anaerolineaceae bacterium]|nr:WD40 repeat domain-containing protein [Anaerolineaceae bacterium]